MSSVEPSLIALFVVILLIAGVLLLRLPVALLLALLGFGGYAMLDGVENALLMLGNELWGAFSGYGLTVVPLFVLMGQICFHSGMSERLYRSVHALTGHRRGGIAAATLLACGAFSAICGSNTATAATMTSVALPQMRRYGYHPIIATGSIAAGTTLGVIIPPSVVAIVVGVQTSLSIQRLFLSGIIPGMLLLGGFLLVVLAVSLLRPAWMPAGNRASRAEKLQALPGLLETIVLFILVICGMSLGVFTPTEAGAAGCALALVIGFFRRGLDGRGIRAALGESMGISAMIFLLMAGAAIFGKFLALTRLPFTLADAIAAWHVSGWLVLTIMGAVFLAGGMIMDSLALLVMTLPVFYPLAEKVGWDPLWFCMLLIVITSMVAITPPVGVSSYVVSSMSGQGGSRERVPLDKVFAGALMFLPSFIVTLLLMALFPSLSLWLPSQLGL